MASLACAPGMWDKVTLWQDPTQSLLLQWVCLVLLSWDSLSPGFNR